MKGKQLQNAMDVLSGHKSGGFMRPFLGKDGRSYVMVHVGGDREDLANYEKRPINVNATLRFDEWRQIDDAVQMVGRQRLVGFDDLRRFNLVYPLGNAMGTTILTWQQMSDALSAELSIDPVRRGNNDRPAFTYQHTPIPVVDSDYTIGDRVLQESRNRGNGLDVLTAEQAARRVAEKLEDTLFGATSSFVYGGGTIFTYLTETNRNQGSLASAWDASSSTIFNDVKRMKQASINDKYYGPWILYVPTNYDTVLDEDYSISGASLKTIRQRIMDINGIADVKVVDRLPADNVLLVSMQREVVDLIDGMPMQNVEWDSDPFTHNYKVMAIQVPRVKSDANGGSGVVHFTA